MFNKRQILDIFLVILIASVVFLVRISETDAGLWEPWETSTILVARQMSHSSIVESTFWVPQLDGALVSQPYLQLWSLLAVLHSHPNPSAFFLRLPSACVGIFLVVMFFAAVRQASTRRSAWVSSLILLTMPMFVFGGKLLHGDIWLILAVSLPCLLYVMSIYATTRRMQRVMIALTGLSLTVSFLSGGLFAIGILVVIGLVYGFLIRKHPQHAYVLWPLKTRYFLHPLYVSFVISGILFGVYLTNVRYALEYRSPMTLTELNDALDENRVVSIERRGTQVIGKYHPTGFESEKPFILVESAENQNTNATAIFALNENERRTFENFLMWRFQSKNIAETLTEVPPMGDSLWVSLKFFMLRTNSPFVEAPALLARVKENLTIQLMEERDPQMSHFMAAEDLSYWPQMSLSTGDLVKIVENDPSQSWVGIEDGYGQHGYVDRGKIDVLKQNPYVPWRWWFDILFYGLVPWVAFLPMVLVGGFVSCKKLVISESVFHGEFCFDEGTPGADQRSPFQSLMVGWFLVSLIVLLPGIYPHVHDFFVGMVPMASLLGIGLSSSVFWHDIRKSLEARFFWIVFAIASFAVSLVGLNGSYFRLIKYLLTDPLMHWHYAEMQQNISFIIYFCISLIIVFVAFTGVSDWIQEKYQGLMQSRQAGETDTQSTASSSAVARVGRGNSTWMPITPVVSFLFLGVLSSVYIYYYYFPAISDEFTETALIGRYFDLADQSEPVYLLSGENTQLCQSYRDCDPGYVCQNGRCHISTFASYSLEVARSMSREDMIAALNQVDTVPAFYIIPKDTLYGLNQSYRMGFSTESRKNLTVVDAPSSRLYLIGNHKEVESINPFDRMFVKELPENASSRQINLSEAVELEGFRIDKLDVEYTKKLHLTLFYRIKQTLEDTQSFEFEFEVRGRRRSYTRPMFGHFDERRLLVGDLISDSMEFEDGMMPSHGALDIRIGLSREGSKTGELHNLTTIEF